MQEPGQTYKLSSGMMDTKEEFIKMVGLQKHQTFIRNNYSIQESTTNSNVFNTNSKSVYEEFHRKTGYTHFGKF